MAFPEKSILIVGGGIVGLCLAVVAQARGYIVTLVARDAATDTASGVAAGMIAPALEAMNDPDPVAGFQRLKSAQDAWLRNFDLWPEPVRRALADGMSKPVLYTWNNAFNPRGTNEAVRPVLERMGARSRWLDDDALRIAGFDPEVDGVVRVEDDWLVEASGVLAALCLAVEAGGTIIRDTVVELDRASVSLASGERLLADHVVLAAGYAATAFAAAIPSVNALTPIKGHLFDLPGQGRPGVVRSAMGYLADYGASAKFGASMEPGRDDLAIDPAVVADLKARAADISADISLEGAVPRTGIRASTPDGWPLIGLDSASGVWLAAGMRRNGYVFAPFAAEVILDRIEGLPRPDAAAYNPQRFL